MTTSTLTAARPRSRLWLKLVACAVVLLGTPLGFVWYLAWSEEREYQALLAETDRLDPGWRLGEILAALPALPDEQNSAKQAEKAWKAMVGPVKTWSDVEKQFNDLPPNMSLPAPLTDALRKLLAENAKARATALLVKDMPEGRLFVPAISDWENYDSDHFMKLLGLGQLMELDTVLAAQERNPAQVEASLRAEINLGRSMGNNPSLMGQLIANACLVRSIVALERALAQLELPAVDLTAIQKLLEREADEPRMAWAMRGERAGQLFFLDAIVEGQIERSAFRNARNKFGWLADWAPWTTPIDRINTLRAMNQLVETVKLPVEKQFDELKRLQVEWENQDTGTKYLAGSLSGIIADRTKLRCAIPALAAERYRQQHGDWPASLDALVQAGLLKAVPVDPYDGKALRFRRLADGVVIYSVGMDRIDNGGIVERQNPNPAVGDIGFRLWDKGARGQPHRPLPAAGGN